ncbi:MAG: HIT domain-containing protein [Lentimicrobium sp.]|nr:HIT domain-containing protein [Lentimicrobium sp.]
METKCPFCTEHIKESAFAGENNFLAIYNHSPILPGHSLVIPARHVNSLFDLTEDEISAFFGFARKITSFLKNMYGTDAYDWSLQEGESAGQSLEHLHLHIIPRKPGDLPEGEDWYIKLEEQKKHKIDVPGRSILNEWDYKRISMELKEKWAIRKD